MVRRVTCSNYIGRVHERAQLDAALDAAVQGEPALVLIGGEAGIGKTRLVAEVEAGARRREGMVLRGQCVQTTIGSTAFAPFVEILHRLHEDAPADLASIDERARNELARLVPRLGPTRPTGRTSTDESPLPLFHAVDEILRYVAERRPLVLVVEDIHWADASTLDLLRFLATRLGSQRLLGVATFRSDEIYQNDAMPRFLAEAERLPTVQRIELLHLTRLEVADQIGGIVGARPDQDLVDRIFDRSDGNPFFVEELLSGEMLAGSRPKSLGDVLAGRIAAVSSDARTIIRVAATIGRESDHRLLARVAGLPDDRLVAGLRETVDHHLLVPTDDAPEARFGFRHALIQELAYAQLLPPERIALHASLAAALEEEGGAAAEVAHHAYRARDLPKALVRSLDAAHDAIAALAFAEALAHLERCRELWPAVDAPESLTGRDRPDLLMLASRCAAASGERERARDLARDALKDLDPITRRERRVRVLLDLYLLEADAGNPAGRDQVTFEAAELMPATPAASPLRARVLMNLAGTHELNGRAEEARRLAEEALDVARAADAPELEAEALVRLADVVGVPFGQPVTAVALIDRAAGILAAQPESSDRLLGRMWLLRAWRQHLAGSFQAALETVDGAIARAAQAGTLALHEDELRLTKIDALVDLGRWTEAEALVAEDARVGPVAHGMAMDSFIGVLVRSGRLSEAAAALRRQRPPDYAADPLEVMVGSILLANAEWRWDDARTVADKTIAARPDAAQAADCWFLLAAAVEGEADHAELARQRRRTTEAEEARAIGSERYEVLKRSMGAAIALGGAGLLAEAVLATVEAETSRLEQRPDPAAWEEAARRRDALPQPWDGAYARFRHAQALLESRGSRTKVASLLHEADRVADELGAVPLRAQIESLALRARIDMATVPAGDSTRRAVTDEGISVALTRREREVLSLVAAGHTNREIAARLFMSDKTASVHVTNVMDKLGALSRYEAAAVATRLGLLGDGVETLRREEGRRAG